MAFDEQRRLDSPTGANLNLYICRVASPRGVVQINHGLAEHAGRYARFAGFLAGRGYAAYAHDHRGHGGTTAPDAPRGRFAGSGGSEKVVADVAAVHDLIATEHPGLPVILFGHSMGGLVALNVLLRHSHRVAAAAIWNANVAPRWLARAAFGLLAYERFRLGSDMPSRLLPRLTFEAWGKAIENRRTGLDWLSRDAAEIDAYVADPLCGWAASVSLWRDLFGFIDDAGADDSFLGVRRDLPVNLVGGGGDPSTDYGQAIERLAQRLRRMGFSNLVSTTYAQTRHEGLNEVNRNIIMAAFADWADRVTGGQ